MEHMEHGTLRKPVCNACQIVKGFVDSIFFIPAGLLTPKPPLEVHISFKTVNYTSNSKCHNICYMHSKEQQIFFLKFKQLIFLINLIIQKRGIYLILINNS